MKNNNRTYQYKGIGFCGILALLFIALKLLGKITWSWLWVLAPLWLPTVLVITILLVALIFALLVEVLHK